MNALDKTFSANHFQGKDVLGGNAHNLNDDDIWGKKTFVSLDEIQSVEPPLIDTSNRLTHSPGPSEIQKLHWSLSGIAVKRTFFPGTKQGLLTTAQFFCFKTTHL